MFVAFFYIFITSIYFICCEKMLLFVWILCKIVYMLNLHCIQPAWENSEKGIRKMGHFIQNSDFFPQMSIFSLKSADKFW